MKRPVRLALVGCGGIAGNHVRGYSDLFGRGCKEFEVTACCDVKGENAMQRAKEIAQFQGREPSVFTDTEELIKSRVANAVDVCVPHYCHHTIAIPLLQGGMHVMVEKPIGITIKATKKIIQAAKKHKRVLATAENIRRSLPPRACEWAINRKRLIGNVLLANVQSIGYDPFNYGNPAFKWRGVKLLTGGGMIMDSGAHFGDMMQVLFGEVDEVYCTMRTYDTRLIEDAPVVGDVRADVEDTWHAVIRFKSGLHVTWTYSRSFHGDRVLAGNYYGSAGAMKDMGFAFHCFEGGATAVLADGTTVTSEQIQSEYMASLMKKQKACLFPYGATNGFSVEVWDFVNAIATRRKPEMDGTDGLRAKALCECCYESATAGKPVKFADVLEGKVNRYQKPIDDFWRI